MNILINYILKYKYFILCLILLFVLIFLILYFDNNKEIEIENADEISLIVSEEIEEPVNIKIKVDVKGYVKKSGVYELDSDSRVIDAINAAGGLKENAYTKNINLSKKLVDENVIIVYSEKEISDLKKEDVVIIEYECQCPDSINDACVSDDMLVSESSKDDTKDNKDDKISINYASKEELMTLSGIGESKADAIIEYRNTNGNFKELEDIMNVSGIGESAYQKIKDYIKL